MWMRIKKAHSFSNGIMFNSNHNPKYVVMATIDKDDNIKTKWLSEQVAQVEEKSQNTEYEKKQFRLFSIFLSFMSTPIIVILLLHLIDVKHTFKFLRIFDGVMLPVFFICLVINVMVSSVVSCHFVKALTNTHKFHAAEHMIVNAYSKLHRIPYLDELREYSRFYTYCGTNIFTIILIHCIFLLIYLLLKLDFILCYILILTFDTLLLLGLLNFVQVFTTEPPTDRELKVALEGLKVWLENEQKSDENDC